MKYKSCHILSKYIRSKEKGQMITHCAFGAVDRINTIALLKHPSNDPCLFFFLFTRAQLDEFINVNLLTSADGDNNYR